MKTFEVELRRTSYIVIAVQAETQDEAEELAWKELDNRADTGHATWEVESVEEMK
jgi:hypothetical protein